MAYKKNNTIHFNETKVIIYQTLNNFMMLKYASALAGMARWIECWPVNQKVTSLIPSQGTRLGYGPGPQMVVHARQHIDVSLAHLCFSPSLSPSLPLSLKMNE